MNNYHIKIYTQYKLFLTQNNTNLINIISNLFFLCITVLVFTACGGTSDSTEEYVQETSETPTEEENTTNTTTQEKKDLPADDRFLEITFEGGIFDGKTMKCKMRYSANDQSTVEKDKTYTELEFARTLNDEDGLQIDFQVLWSGGLSKGEKTLNTEYPSKIEVINPDKDSKYDFERIVYEPQAVSHTITNVGEWKSRASNDAVLFEGEGKFSNCKVRKFTSRFESTQEPSVNISFKYKARAIRY